MKMLLYRIEHKETGIGPFCGWLMGRVNRDKDWENYECARSYAARMPGPSNDILDNHWADFRGHFAFTSIIPAQTYFGKWAKSWDIMGFVLRLYSVKDEHCVIGNEQAVFRKNLATLLDECRLPEILS